MQFTNIKLSYSKLIGPDYKTAFEKNVFEDSYQEFLMQSQAYNPTRKFQTLEEMIKANPKANSLHYKVGFSVGLYVNELENTIPDLRDNAGYNSIIFKTYDFRIVQSSVQSKKGHLVSLSFTTGNYLLLEHFGEYLLISPQEELMERLPLATTLIRIQPGLSISEVSRCEVDKD